MEDAGMRMRGGGMRMIRCPEEDEGEGDHGRKARRVLGG